MAERIRVYAGPRDFAKDTADKAKPLGTKLDRLAMADISVALKVVQTVADNNADGANCKRSTRDAEASTEDEQQEKDLRVSYPELQYAWRPMYTSSTRRHRMELPEMLCLPPWSRAADFLFRQCHAMESMKGKKKKRTVGVVSA